MLKRLVATGALSLLLGASGLAQDAPTPAPEMANAKYFVGSWTCSGDAPASPFGPAHKTQTSLKLKSDLDGFWIAGTLAEAKTASNRIPVKGMFHLGYDPGSKQYVVVWLDNFGSWSTEMSPGWQGDSISFAGDQTVMGKKGVARDTFVKKSETEFTHKFELRLDGKTSTIVEETCKKVAKK
jgi:hypothetical protein